MESPRKSELNTSVDFTRNAGYKSLTKLSDYAKNLKGL